ncbi:MAG: hypothetical protein ACJ0BE_05040 [Dehalococcoidia bacterium]
MNISLKAIVRFSATKPLVIIGLWVLLMICAGILSQTLLDSALKGGQGATVDQEFKLAQKLKDEKTSLLNPGSGQIDQSSEEETSDNLLIVNSDKYVFPSEDYVQGVRDLLKKFN